MNFNDNFEIEERIDRYLDNTMTEAEKTAFEIEINNSPELEEQVELNQLIKTYHEHPEIPDVRKLIQSTMTKQQVEIPAEYKENTITKAFATPENRFTIRRILPIAALAASIVLAIIIVPYFMPTGDVFVDNFKPTPDLSISFKDEKLQLISEEKRTDLNKQVKTIEKALKHKEYDKALDLLDALFQKNWYKDELFIYRANALLGKGETQQAIEEYQTLLDNNTKFKNMTKWYLALAYIKDKNLEKAKSLLEVLSNTSDKDYQKKAKQLLKKL
jgi:tetratricopeptide (TPR) repeat protein